MPFMTCSVSVNSQTQTHECFISSAVLGSEDWLEDWLGLLHLLLIPQSCKEYFILFYSLFKNLFCEQRCVFFAFAYAFIYLIFNFKNCIFIKLTILRCSLSNEKELK